MVPPCGFTAETPMIGPQDCRAAAEGTKATSSTIDGEAAVVGPDGLSRFDDLRRHSAALAAILFAFDLIEHDGDDLRDLPVLDRNAKLARPLRDTEAGILLNEHVTDDGLAVFARLPAWRSGHRLKEDRRHLSIGSVPGLDQGPQSREHCCAAGAQREFK